MTPTLSVVVPVCDEERSLQELYARVRAVLDQLELSWELIFVDDGSIDGSYGIMVGMHRMDPRVRVVKLSRNFGKESAMSAGLDLAVGEAVVTMDSDLQHPPEVIRDFVQLWREGYDVVYGVQDDRTQQGRVKRLTAVAYYRILRRLSDIDMPEASGDFRLANRRAMNAYRRLRERNRYVRGMFSWIGMRQIGVRYSPPPRVSGETKFTLRRLIRLGTVGVLSFSSAPLRFVLKLGFVVSGIALLEGLYAIVGKIGGFYGVPGWASIVTVVSFIGGFQLIVLGVIGQYVGLVYEEVKARPLFLTEALHGFDRRIPTEDVGALMEEDLRAVPGIVSDR